MSAYPQITEELQPEFSYHVAPGSLISLSFTLPELETIRFRAVRTADTQDSSIRCWLSREPGGSSIELIHPVSSYWHLNKVNVMEIVLANTPTPILNPYTTSYVIRGEPGLYYFNALNMVLSENAFYVSHQVGELDD